MLRGDTVFYVSAPDIRRAIEYDLEQEKAFDYTGLYIDQIVTHITQFVSGLWQIHPFGEGNTRTTAVFTIQYLRSMGFNVENDLLPIILGISVMLWLEPIIKTYKRHQKRACVFRTILPKSIDRRKQ